jgi:O-acetylhomoserine/O-acetylserine sulfhydrylase-like pyridoxal-dependent enzyme
VQLAALQGASTAAFASLDGNINFVLFIPCIIDNRIMTPNQQNAETCSLDIDTQQKLTQNCAMYLTKASSVHYVKYVGCFQDTVHQDLSHLHNNFTN